MDSVHNLSDELALVLLWAGLLCAKTPIAYVLARYEWLQRPRPLCGEWPLRLAGHPAPAAPVAAGRTRTGRDGAGGRRWQWRRGVVAVGPRPGACRYSAGVCAQPGRCGHVLCARRRGDTDYALWAGCL